uniref:PIH1 domain-containing protein 2 n=1 Tax=Ciona intestinalis TaxID=7719 RepID=H2XUJ2_CIOIN|nr:PIH1 domain-containing protein 2 [Ciona intestinalis]|eukprot:XP_002129686.1 PIH1 domain-containing protein 2 [Ciona intestinalis]
MDSKEMQEQANYIWNRLDDLAGSDPDAYKKFIETQMTEREKFLSAPEPKFCFETFVTESKTPVFVNVCTWRRIPPPADDNEAVKLLTGFKTTHKGPKGKYITIPIALNDKILEEILETAGDKQEMMKLTIHVIQAEHKISLSSNFKECRDIFKGDLPANPRALFVENPNSDTSIMDASKLAKKCQAQTGKGADILTSPEILLQNLASATAETDTVLNGTDFVKNLTEKGKTNGEKKPKVKLIEEIAVPLDVPVHMLQEHEADNGKPHRFTLKVNLPLVESVAECDLEISQDEVELSVEKKYYLKFPLPRSIDNENTSARFVRKNNVLTITMPITGT